MIRRVHLLALLVGPAGAAGCGAAPAPARSAVDSAGPETLNARVALGAKLFREVRLSVDSTISCATCHDPYRAFTEPRALSHGIGMRARVRNAPSLLSIAAIHTSFDWDGRARTLEDQLHGVFSVDGDMGMDLTEAVARVGADSQYSKAFQHAYHRPPDLEAFLAAFATFQRSLVVSGSRFDRFYLGADSSALTDSEKRGWALYRRVGCIGCHVPLPARGEAGVLLFTDDHFHNLGVGYTQGRMADLGRYLVTRHFEHWGSFRTPSLRNVALTAPYMHDGSLPSLEEVVRFYDQGGTPNPNRDVIIVPLGLSERERADLVAFLRTLTTEWLTDSAEVASRLLRE